MHTRTRSFTWSFLLAPVAFPIIGADFLCNFKLMVDISNKRLVARGGQLIQLVLGKHTSAAVVTGLMAAPSPPAVGPSTPSRPTVEARASTPSPSSRCPQGKAASRHVGASKRPTEAKRAAPPPAVAPPAPSPPTGEAPWSGAGQLAAGQHVGAAKQLLQKYKAVVGASKRLPPVKHAVEHLIETTACPPSGLPLPPTGSRAAGRRQGGICRHGVPGHHPEIQEQLVFTAAHGGEVRRLLAALRRLPAAEPGHQAGHVPAAPHGGSLGPAGRQEGLLQAGSAEGVLPGASGRQGRPQDGGDHPLRPL